MIIKCKWCGIYFIETIDKLEYCSEKCKEAANEKESQNF